MSFETEIIEQINQINEYLNGMRANSKRIDELPTSTTGSKLLAAWNEVSERTEQISRENLVSQNNKGRVLNLGNFAGVNPFNEVIAKMNARTTVVTETDTPVILYGLKPAGTGVPGSAAFDQSLKYAFLFIPGKGTYGAGTGSTTVTGVMLYMLPIENMTPADILPNEFTQIIDLGQIESQADFIDAANTEAHVVDDPDIAYYFSYYILENEGEPEEQNVLYIALFVGDPGTYGGASPDQFVSDDFVATTNSNTPPGPAVPGLHAVLGIQNVSTRTIILRSGSDGIEYKARGFTYSRLFQNVNILFEYPAAASVTYMIPAKTSNDVFAMISDLATKADLVSGKVPASQLPSYVDDVINLVNIVSSYPTSGMTIGDIYFNTTTNKVFTADSATTGIVSDPETGKIYINTFNNTQWRWSGVVLVQVSESLALGETESTAYRGDRGKTAYDHSQITNANPHATTITQIIGLTETLITTGGALNNQATATGLLRFNNGTTPVILSGLTNPVDGKRVYLINNTLANLTLLHESSSSSSANRLLNNNAQDLFISVGGTALYIYSSAVGKWILTELWGSDYMPTMIGATRRSLEVTPEGYPVASEIVELKVWNTTSTAFTKATLNSTYASFKRGQQVVCPNITGGGKIYEKWDDSSNDWFSINITAVT